MSPELVLTQGMCLPNSPSTTPSLQRAGSHDIRLTASLGGPCPTLGRSLRSSLGEVDQDLRQLPVESV